MFILLIGIGLLSGLIGGTLGIGGGVVTVPALFGLFFYLGMFSGQEMQVAASTSLAAAFVISFISTILQMRKKAVPFYLLKWMAPALLIGSILGALTAHYLPSLLLSKIFAILALILGGYFCFPKLPNLQIAKAPNPTLSLFALLIGILSSMLGIGGGSIAFPILLFYQCPPKQASAGASAATFVSTACGTLAYLLIGEKNPLPGSYGYIDFFAWACISLGALIMVPIGVKLSHVLSVSIIKRTFGVCLMLIGLSMILL